MINPFSFASTVFQNEKLIIDRFEPEHQHRISIKFQDLFCKGFQTNLEVSGGRRGLVVYASDCGEEGPGLESRTRQQNLFFWFNSNLLTTFTPAVPGVIAGSNQQVRNKEYACRVIQIICTSLTTTGFEQASWLLYPRRMESSSSFYRVSDACP